MAAPTFVNVGATASSASATTLTPALNATRTNNNILFSFIIVNGGGKTPTTATAGWTVGDSNNTGSSSAAWAWRIVDGTETAAVWTWTGAAACTGYVAQYTGNATVSPIDVTGKATGTTSAMTFASVTTATVNCAILQYASTVASNTLPGTPFNYTLRVTANSGGNGNGRLFDGVIFDPNPAQGGSGTITNAATGAISAANWNTFAIGLKGTGATLGSWVRATQAVLQILRSVQGSPEIPILRTPQPPELIRYNRIRAPDHFAWSGFTPPPVVPPMGWFFPLSEPVRRISTRNLVTEPVLIIPITDQGIAWLMPFSDPQRLPNIPEYAEQPVLIWPVPIVEAGMAWFMPFQSPVRIMSVAEYAESPVLVYPGYDVSIIINAIEAPDAGNLILQSFNEALKVRIGYGKPH